MYEGGALLTLGGEMAGHKGLGWSLASALIGGLAIIGDENHSPTEAMSQPSEWEIPFGGVFVMAIDPAAFGDAVAYRGQVGRVLARWRRCRRFPEESGCWCRAMQAA
jgi:hydroxycarboxylate dehydrogenase B